jgi:hypothetical protein
MPDPALDERSRRHNIGKSGARKAAATEGFRPDGTAVPVTRDSIASGALSAGVRPLKPAKPYIAGVPTA